MGENKRLKEAIRRLNAMRIAATGDDATGAKPDGLGLLEWTVARLETLTSTTHALVDMIDEREAPADEIAAWLRWGVAHDMFRR